PQRAHGGADPGLVLRHAGDPARRDPRLDQPGQHRILVRPDRAVAERQRLLLRGHPLRHTGHRGDAGRGRALGGAERGAGAVLRGAAAGGALRGAAHHQPVHHPVQGHQPGHGDRRHGPDLPDQAHRERDLPDVPGLHDLHPDLFVHGLADLGAGRPPRAQVSGQFQESSMIEFLHTYGMMFLVGSWPNGPIGGFAGTLVLAALGLAGAFPFALLIGVARTSENRAVQWASMAWVYTFRSIPLIMIVFWAYFLLPALTGMEVPPFSTALAAIIVYESAFLAEIVRAAIPPLPAGQAAAARAVGLGYFQTMWSVQLPQALSNMIPSLLNQFVSTIKATSIVYIIGVQEAAFSAQQINSIELTGALRTYLVLALFYFLLCALL